MLPAVFPQNSSRGIAKMPRFLRPSLGTRRILRTGQVGRPYSNSILLSQKAHEVAKEPVAPPRSAEPIDPRINFKYQVWPG